MAKSKARRQREHLARNGKMGPEHVRGIRPDFSTHVRRMPTKQERIKRAMTKYRYRCDDI